MKTKLYPVFKSYNQILGGPGNQMRPSQVQFIITCYEGVANNIPVVIEGPTGLGKTKALLTVAIAFLNEGTNRRVIYTTRTIPQLQNVDNDLSGIPFDKENILNYPAEFYYYSVYIGIGSLRRIACSKHIEDITFDTKKIKYFRTLMDDPEKPESCPDCPLRKLKSREPDTSLIEGKKRFGLEEINHILINGFCPMPYMKYASMNSSIMVTTYPYLHNEFWKTCFLGKSDQRINCLPIIDEAHNLLENLTSQSALSIHLSDEIDEDTVLDLNSNTYHLAYLISDFKYGFKEVILGPLNVIFGEMLLGNDNTCDKLINKRNSLIEENKSLRDKNKRLQDLYEQLKKTNKNKREFYSGDFPSYWKSEIDKAISYFRDAEYYAGRRDQYQIKISERKNEKRSLCKINSERAQKRGYYRDKQKEAKEFKYLYTTIDYYDFKAKADELYEQEKYTREIITAKNSEIEELIRIKSDYDENQKKSWEQGKQILNKVFKAIKSKINSCSASIDEKSNKIESLNENIDSLKSKKNNIQEIINNLKSVEIDEWAIKNHITSLSEEYSDFNYDFCEIQSSIDFGFSLFDFLSAFRNILVEILRRIPAGTITESQLSDLSSGLNSELVNRSGIDIFRFMDSCEKAVEYFEQYKLKSKTSYEGKAIYALKQMFNILTSIHHAPFGFGAMLNKEKNEPSIHFFSLDPSKIFKHLYHDLRSPILASATLSPVNDVTRVLGIDNAIRAKIKPVFPAGNYLSFAFIGVHSSINDYDGNSSIFNELERKILKNNILKIIRNTKKHTGLFCASHNVLDATLELINRSAVNSCGCKFLVARSDRKIPEDDYSELKNMVSSELFSGLDDFDSRLVLFKEMAGKIPVVMAGVSGGGLAEGVDYKGEMMEVAIIIGIPYQDEGENKWLNDKRTGFFKMREGNIETGKDLAYRQSALRKIAQTAGRVHRTIHDKGIILFFDERLLGIKNNSPTGYSRYEILHPGNTFKHWTIIQERILERLCIIKPPEMEKSELIQLEGKIKRVFASSIYKPGFIEFDEFLESIKTFTQ